MKVSVAVVLPYSMFKMREYKQIIMKSAMTLEGSAFEEMFDLSPYLEMVQPIPAPIEVLGKICDQVSSLCIMYILNLITYLRFDYRLYVDSMSFSICPKYN